MGCDIHNIVEVKVDGKWIVNPNPVFKNGWYREDEKDMAKENQWNLAINEMVTKPHEGRNYDWFAILANVRNGRGFAGISTGAGFDVIAMPRGLPDDISEEALQLFCYGITDDKDKLNNDEERDLYYITKEEAIKWVENYGSKFITVGDNEYVTNCDYHSNSYLTIEDFNKFDWNQLTMKYGVVTFDQYKKLKGSNNTPDDWCGSVSGDKQITISEEDANKIINGELKELTREVSWINKEELTLPIEDWVINVEYSWSVLYSEWFENKITTIIEPLRELSDLYDDVRFVFGFDN